MKQTARGLFLLVFATMALATRSAHAQSPTADDLIKEGVDHRRQGDDAAALTFFVRAYTLAPTAHALAQEALAEQALGRWAEANDHLQKALSDTADSWVAKNRAELEDSLATIHNRVGQLEILGGQSGAEVRVNGRLAGTLPLSAPITVEAGQATLDVRLPGYLPIERNVAVAAQALSRETVTLVPEAVAPPPPAAAVLASGQATTPSSWTHTRSAWAISVGSLGLLTTVVAEIVRYRDFSDFENRSDCGTGFPGYGGSGCQSLHDHAVLAQDFVVAGLAVAAIGLGVGTYWLATDADRHEAVRASASGFSCVAAPVTSGAGGHLGCVLHF